MTTTPRPVPSVRSYSDVKNLAGTFQPATPRRRHIPAVTRHEQTLARHERAIANLRAAHAIERRRRQTLEEHLTTVKNIAYGSAVACIVLSIGFTLQLAGAR
nr:MAG TPA: hypothetical protein [Caudoviricetes sp.]